MSKKRDLQPAQVDAGPGPEADVAEELRSMRSSQLCAECGSSSPLGEPLGHLPVCSHHPDRPPHVAKALYLLCRSSARLPGQNPMGAALGKLVGEMVEFPAFALGQSSTLQLIAEALSHDPHAGDAAQDVRLAIEALG